jgi:adenosine deaminase
MTTTGDLDRIPRDRLPSLLRTAPKAELHIHIEGSLEPELIFKLAQRNGVKLDYPSVDALRAAYAFTDLQSFLDIYYAGASVLLKEDDFFDMAWAYFERAAADNIVRAELFFDPQTHTARGVDIGVVIRGLHHACQRAHQELGISADLILCFLRHLSEDDALATLEAALPYRQHFIGVGLDSSERGHPPEKFARVFAKCRALGLHLVAHAGEEGPPAYERTRRAEGRAHRPRRAQPRGPRAGEAPGEGARAADGVPAVEREAVRVQGPVAAQPAGAARRGSGRDAEQRRPRVLRRLPQ